MQLPKATHPKNQKIKIKHENMHQQLRTKNKNNSSRMISSWINILAVLFLTHDKLAILDQLQIYFTYVVATNRAVIFLGHRNAAVIFTPVLVCKIK
jgi:hypothetical protein